MQNAFQTDFSVQLLPGMAELAVAHTRAGQQPDNLCGPYWVSALLRAWGFSEASPELIAQLAGSVLPVGDPTTWLPAGAQSRQDYTLPLPQTRSLNDAGTSAQGLINAAFKASDGSYSLLPLQAHWSAERVEAVIHLCRQNPDWKAIPLCNLRTGHLWGACLSVGEALAYLSGQSVTPPPPDWNVGHFLALAGTIQGTARSLVLVCDTYPIFGWQGYHLQTAAAIAAALNRGDEVGGGILLFIATQDKAQAAQQAKEQGFDIAIWDNGSPMGSDR